MIYEYIPKGVCSKKILIEYNEDKIINVEFKGGCNGNGKGITSLVKGESFSEIIDKSKFGFISLSKALFLTSF